MGQDQSVATEGKAATTAQEFVSALTGGQLGDSGNHEQGLGDITLIPGIDEYTPNQVRQLHTFLEGQAGELRRTITALAKNKNEGFTRQFASITAGKGNASQASALSPNLNRYFNIVAYDHSRVTITPNKHNFNCDYVNANWVDGCDRPKAYIASQGPVPDAMIGFWQMVWESKVQLIVMVTNEVEGGKLKCHRYWPDPFNGGPDSVAFGPVRVTYLQQEVFSTFMERTFEVTFEGSTEKREVLQIAYTAWPDHGVPSSTKELLNFRQHVKTRSGSYAGPVLVHCSAGVGRTGTFMGVDRFLGHVVRLENRSVLSIVEELRNQRNFMVQSAIQFVFLYLCCLDGVERMMKITSKMLKFIAMSPTDRFEAELEDMRDEIEKQTEVFNTLKLKARQKRGDLAGVFGIGNDDRLKSLQKSQNAWEKSKPSLDDKGVSHGAVGLSPRKAALDASITTYDQARRAWEKEVDGEGNEYNVLETLAPMESRLQALASANLASQQQNHRQVVESDFKASIATLEIRLQSLQRCILEEPWRDRGDGLRGKVQHDAGVRKHTAENVGGLNARFEKLQDAISIILRDNQGAVTYYEGEESFRKEVAEQRKLQANVMKMRMDEKRRAEQEEADRQALAEKKAAEEEQRAEAARIEEERKQKRINTFAMQTTEKQYDPKKARADKVKAMEDEEKRAEELQNQLRKNEEDKKKKEEDKEKKKYKAASKAAKFLSKMK